MAPADLQADLALITHAHGDHCDPATLKDLAAVRPSCVFCGPYPVRRQLADWQLGDRIRTVRVGAWASFGGAAVMAVPAAHETFEPDGSGEPAHFGFVVRTGGVTVYHAGDTLAWPGLVELLRPHDIDVALLPVNGRDEARTRAGIVGNMRPDEAMELATAIGARTVVPIHNDLFAVNRTPWESVREAAGRLPPTCAFLPLAAGERHVLEGWTG
jgi:L-ascorbate metabolism protein UlaG (beta-lactamase superfamily)